MVTKSFAESSLERKHYCLEPQNLPRIKTSIDSLHCSEMSVRLSRDIHVARVIQILNVKNPA